MPAAMNTYLKLRFLMIERGYDQEYLGKKLKRSPTYISQRMTAKRPWSQTDMYDICDIFQIPYHEIPEYFPRKGGATAKLRKIG